MPGRQSHGGAPSAKQPKSRANNKKRSLNAFAIAAQQNPEKVKLRQHRLGESEGGNRPGKRARDEDNDEADEDASTVKKRKPITKGRFDELDIDAGSDSDGNEWRMGEVDSDDDSDLDSDEAFGESDEEKFDGYAFSGSSSKDKTRKKSKCTTSKEITLDEDDNSDFESELDEDDLGEGAVDLATMLDASEESEEDTKVPATHDNTDEGESEEEESDEESDGSDEESSFSSMEDDENDTEKLTALQNLVANLPQADLSKAPVRQRSDGVNEYATPSDFGVSSKTKLTLEDLGLPSVRDPFVKKSLKLLASKSKTDANRNGISGKLEVPLAKRQQDQLDRSAAYDKSKETLNRWIDTVKHNRRAEHLIFPLPDADAASANANVRLQPTTNSKPFNDLEATIQSILEESGLAPANGKTDEDKLMEFEELETKKMSIEEVKARQAQLRMARDLLFREEARAKRIKKIKSKSFRRVHRKEREKEDRLNKEALIEAGIDPSEDEQELQDRRRAEERMGAKHRGSKWAKATKATGRAAWDEDARAGITEMARRDEELRKRVEGRATRKDGVDESESSESESEDDGSEEDDLRQDRLLQKLDRVSSSDVFANSSQGSRLSNMKFMLKAEASRKKENDATVEQMRRELAGEESSDNDEDAAGDVGRRTFGFKVGEIKGPNSTDHKVSDFEEAYGTDSDQEVEIRTTAKEREAPATKPLKSGKTSSKGSTSTVTYPGSDRAVQITSNTANASSEGGAWSRTAPPKDPSTQSEARRRKQKRSTADVEELDFSNAAVIAKQVQPKKKTNGHQTTLHAGDSDDDDSDDDGEVRLPFAIRDQELIKRAFAGADVVGEFEAEKLQTIQDEDEKVVDNTLPGWGSWVGDGVSKKDKRQNKGRFLSKIEGVKEQDRKDAKLERVIVNEKRVKKVSYNQILLKTTSTNCSRMASILRLAYHIPLKLDNSMKDLYVCLWDPSGLQRKLSKKLQSRGS